MRVKLGKAEFVVGNVEWVAFFHFDGRIRLLSTQSVYYLVSSHSFTIHTVVNR